MTDRAFHSLISQHIVWNVKGTVLCKIRSALHIVKSQGAGVKPETVEKHLLAIPEIDFAGFSGLDFSSFLVYTKRVPF